jgi:hypothetical protein
VEAEDNAGECVEDTGETTGDDASFGTCGANGTVWILVPHGGGYYLKSRFAEDHGNISMVLSVDPLSNGAPVYVAAPANPGSPYWQTFTHY